MRMLDQFGSAGHLLNGETRCFGYDLEAMQALYLLAVDDVNKVVSEESDIRKFLSLTIG
jgi:hypothetical protein